MFIRPILLNKGSSRETYIFVVEETVMFTVDKWRDCFHVWKTDKLNVAETQIPYWKTQIKNRTAEAKKNEKDLDKIIAEIPLPEGMKW